MNLKTLRCPNCDASLDIEDGLDIFFCKYCGHKILLEGQSKAAYQAKVRVKHMEHEEKMQAQRNAHEERLQERKNAHERYKMEAKKKDDRRSLFGVFIALGIFAILGVIIASITITGNAGAERQEQELKAIVEEIMLDIENKDFDAAYIKANSLYWDDSWTSEGEDKWDAIREEVLKQIESAENESNGNTSNSIEQDDTDKGIFSWFD